MNINDYIFITSVIPDEDCDLLMSHIEKSPNWKKHSWYSSNDNSYKTNENHELDILSDDIIGQKFVTKYTVQAVQNYNSYVLENSLNSPEVSTISGVRFNRYLPNSMMRPHIDHIREEGQQGIPILTILGELTGHENYDGGEFKINGQSFLLNKGDFIIFPSVFLYKHEVSLMTSGTRYSMVGWCW